MIYLNRVVKYRPSGKGRALAADGVSLAVEDGEFTCLLGPTSSGKTTLLELMAGLIAPSEGSVLAEGERLQELKGRKLRIFRRRKIGFIPQFPDFPDKSALKIVLAPLSPFRVIGDKAAYGRSMLRKVGLEGKEDSRFSQLSGGEKRMLAVARALITRPKIILADEPVNDLDEEGQLRILGLLSDLNQEGKTVVMATRDPEVASAARRIIRVSKGRVEDTESSGDAGEWPEERIITEIS